MVRRCPLSKSCNQNLWKKPNQIETKLNVIWIELIGVRLKGHMDFEMEKVFF